MAWIDDGSNATESNGPTITCKVLTVQTYECQGAQDHGDIYYNALWVDGEGVTSGEHYWTIKFRELKDMPWVGFSNVENLKHGKGFRGLVFCHDLSEGLSCLSTSLGTPYNDIEPVMKYCEKGIQSGDKVGLLVSIDETKMKIYFYVNDVPLGIAFNVPKETLSPVFPVINFNCFGKATIQKETVVPANRERFIPVYEGLERHWALDRERSILEGKKAPSSGNITLDLKKTGENEYSFYMHVINFNIHGSISNSNGKWNASRIISTVMAGQVILEETELRSVFQNIEAIEVIDGILNILSGNNQLRWSRYNPDVYVVTANPFERW